LHFDSVSRVILTNWARGRVALLDDASSHRLCCCIAASEVIGQSTKSLPR
jgi:hypothetical protein